MEVISIMPYRLSEQLTAELQNRKEDYYSLFKNLSYRPIKFKPSLSVDT